MTPTNASSFDFTDSVVLVTGGSAGIGLAISRAFLAAGATVIITGRSRQTLDEALEGTPADRASAMPADVSDPAAVRQLVADVVAVHGRIDVVVSNAAAYTNGPIDKMPDGEWESLRATNIDAFFHLSKAALPVLAASGGSLVAVSSVSGERGDWGQAAYNASKAAVSTFVRSLALDWGRVGVRVNAVAPALTETRMTRSFVATSAFSTLA